MLGIAVPIAKEPGGKVKLEGCVPLGQSRIPAQSITEHELVQVPA